MIFIRDQFAFPRTTQIIFAGLLLCCTRGSNRNEICILCKGQHSNFVVLLFKIIIIAYLKITLLHFSFEIVEKINFKVFSNL